MVIEYFYRPQTKLREGNVFTPICDSVHGGGVGLYPSIQWAGGEHPPGQIPPPRADTTSRHLPNEMAIEAGGTHPTGMHSCYQI